MEADHTGILRKVASTRVRFLVSEATADERSRELLAVILAHPFDAVVFDRAWEEDGLRLTVLPQVAVDLLTSPGRGPAEAEELIDWMEKHESRRRS
jgi:hypothetical protein